MDGEPTRNRLVNILLLSIMMFLQFFVWGAWYVTVGNYMAAHGMSDWISWAYSVGPIAAIISPFFLGMIADRFFATERVLAAMHILGAAAIACAPLVIPATVAENETLSDATSMLFVGILLLHMLCYMPTLGLTNTLAFHNIVDQEFFFPIVRVFGTIGWIVANLVVSWLLEGDTKNIQFFVTAVAAGVLGVFSLILPHTPPPAKGQEIRVRDILGLDSLALMKEPSFAVFMISSFLICIPLAAYYAYAPVFVGATDFQKPAAVMSIGQVSEIFFMLVMPLCFTRLGVKKMLAIGMLAWVVRYGLFAMGATDQVRWMIIGGIVLHGICYDFFFVTGQIYVDKKADPAIRGQAQGFLVFVTQGLGMLIGAQIAGNIFLSTVTGEGAEALPQWQEFWLLPCAAAAVFLLIFFAFFRDKVALDDTIDKADVATAAAAEEMP